MANCLLVLPPQFPDAVQRIAKKPSRWLDLGLLANFQWWPNRDGANWFIREILSHLPGDIRLHLFGNRSSDFAAADPRIFVHGFVDHLREVWSSCDWMVIPVRHGSGISVKAAESIYHGMPILSTSFGLRGLPAIEHPQIVRRDTAEKWVSFLSSPESRKLCQERLPLSVSRHFELEVNVPHCAHFLSRLLQMKPPDSTA